MLMLGLQSTKECENVRKSKSKSISKENDCDGNDEKVN